MQPIYVLLLFQVVSYSKQTGRHEAKIQLINKSNKVARFTLSLYNVIRLSK